MGKLKEIEILRLPTCELKPGMLCENKKTGQMAIATSLNKHLFRSEVKGFHLYFLSDEKMEEGDWAYHPEIAQEYTVIKDGKQTSESWPIKGVFLWKPTNNTWYKKAKKIIATTDSSLDLPRPYPEFLKKYAEAKGIDKVLVQYTFNICNNYDHPFRSIGEKWNVRPFVAKDGTIVIHPIKPKIYTQEEVIKLIHEAKSWIWKQLPEQQSIIIDPFLKEKGLI